MKTVSEISERLGLECLRKGDPAREVRGVYCGDLLSWVMSRAETDCAWITIMSNVNVAAVSEMVDAACIILAEGVQPDDALSKRMEMIGASVFGSPLSTYELSWRLHEILEEE